MACGTENPPIISNTGVNSPPPPIPTAPAIIIASMP